MMEDYEKVWNELPELLFVKLTKGAFAVVSKSDGGLVRAVNWQLHSGNYAAGRTRVLGIRRTVYMHRFVLGVTCKIEVDHINGNRLDNRRCNLRIATRSENAANRTVALNRHGFKGITKNRGRFSAEITVDYRKKFIGSYATPEEAAKAYDKAAKANFGKFANLNFKDGLS